MSIIWNNPILKGASGMLAKTIVYRMWRGRLVMANAPKPRKSLSKGQQQTVSRFKEASQYAVRQLKIEAARAEYQKGTNYDKHSAYLVALTDYMNAPVVHYIKSEDYKGDIGDTITIKAVDDFKVVKVNVTIVDTDGVVVEEGDAVQYVRNRHIWKYQASVVNPNVKGSAIIVTAFDRPGNETTAIVKL